VVFSYLQDKESVNALFNEVVDRVANRPGGYTRIIKLGSRLGDNAEMAMIELVDFNDLLIQESEPKKAKTRRSRRGSSKPKAKQAAATGDTKTEKQEKGAEAQPDEKVGAAAVEDATEVKVEEVQEEGKEDAVETKAEEVKAEEAKAEVVEEKEEKKAAKKVEKPEGKSGEATEEVKAKAEGKTESAKETESNKEEKKESEDSGKEDSEK
jgi:large subunit ribosomal protein L17